MQVISANELPTSEATIEGLTIEATNPEISETISDKRVVDDEDKQRAKARAKQILQGTEADEVLDARPDQKLKEKVEQEIADNTGETDLLNKNSPQE